MKKLEPIKTRTVIIDNGATGRVARVIRIYYGLSLRKMAKMMGCSPTFLSQLERGHRNWAGWIDKFNFAIKELIL